MAEIDVFKRRLFGGLTQPEFQELVDYTKSVGGIPSISVNRGVTAEDVIAATPYLSQHTGGTAVEAVSNFNNFLAGVLSNKFARVDEEKQALETANAAATERVMNVIADADDDLKDRYQVVGDNLIDLKSVAEGSQPSDYIVYEGAKQENIKLGCLKQITQLLGEEVNIYQKLGVLEKAPDRLELSVDADDRYNEIKEIARRVHRQGRNKDGSGN